MNKLTEVLPECISEKVINLNNSTLAVSSVPGIPLLSVMDGAAVRDVLFFGAHRGDYGEFKIERYGMLTKCINSPVSLFVRFIYRVTQ